MIISLIVAVAHGGVIGKDGGLPWHLPGELVYFKQKTMGHPIIMGRKTHESIGRALPGRTNIVITRNPGYKAAEGCIVVGSLDDALARCGNADEVFIIGGESIYAAALPKANKIYLTKVGAQVDGDKFFKFDASQWRQTFSEKHGTDAKNKYPYEFTILEKK